MPTHRSSLPLRMLLGLIVGATAGILCHVWLEGDVRLAWLLTYVARPAGQIFLRLLFLLVLPLLLSALPLGIAGLGDVRSLGRVGLKMLAYTVVVSGIAVLLGVVLVNVLRPGDGLTAEARSRLIESASSRAATVAPSAPAAKGIDLLVQIVPSNAIRAAADGDMLGVMFFALFLGVGLALTRTDAARRLEGALEGLYDVTQRLIGLVISLAPYGVAALLFTMTAELGYEVLWQLARYVAVVLLALALHLVVVYSLAVRFLGGMSPRQFFADIQEPMLVAFSTASSSAALPTALRAAEERLRLPRRVSRFVLTIGATANQNGTALFEGVTVLFLAQLYGVELSLGKQLVVVLVSVLGGVGTAGVPAGSIPVVAMILGIVGVPGEGIGLILGVDRFLDMCRTTLNVTGDLAAAVVVSRGEEELPGAT